MPTRSIDIAPGVALGARYPNGTVFVTELADDNTITATEWDLATKSALRHATIPLPDDVGNVHLVPSGQGARLMAWATGGELFYVHLNAALEAVRTERVGQVQSGGPYGFAADERLAVILSDGIPDAKPVDMSPGGLFAMAFDASGKRIAKRMLAPLGRSSDGSVTVVHGQAYVALSDEHLSLSVLQLTPDLRTVRQKNLPYHQLATIEQSGDGLVLDVLDAPDLLELSLDLSKVTHRPRPPAVPEFPGGRGDQCGAAMLMASQLITLCECGPQTCLAWAPLPP